MSLSAIYTTGTKWKQTSGEGIAIIGSKTLDELFPAENTDFDLSILLNNGSTSPYLNYGAYGKDGYIKKANGSAQIVDGSSGKVIEYLGTCFLSSTSVPAYINLTRRLACNTTWNTVKNYRFIIDCINPNAYGGAPYDWADFSDYPGRKSSCYHFRGSFICNQYGYQTSSGSTSQSNATNAAAVTGDNAKRVIRVITQLRITNYQPTMIDSDTLRSTNCGICYAFRADSEYFLVSDPCNVPLALGVDTEQYMTVGADRYSLSIGNITNTTNSIASADDLNYIWCFGNWSGGVWHNDWQVYYKTLNTALYIVNSSGIRWLDYDEIPANAGQFRARVKLGVMSETGIVNHKEWLIGESAIIASDNPNKEGDYDHIPVRPTPVPGDDEDNTDPVSTTGAPFGTGLAHYYVTTVDSAVLGQISEALGTWDIDNTKKDLYRNLISCKILKPPAGIPSTPSTFEIYGVKPQYNGADISIPAVNGNPDITFGPYSISRKFNDFRDYAPYTRVEIFLPYCGWCALPSHVAGRSVSVSYFTDVIAGTVKAVVFCEANPVAEAAGVMAYDIPFAAQNVGAKIQAANTGMLAYGKAALQLSAGIGQAVASKGKQGMSSIINGAFGVAAGYNQLSMAANENYTEISGKAGDGCALAGIDTIIIKIVRPKYGAYTTPPYVPDGFAHTVGFLSMKQSKVSAASGLILCDNVDTSGIGKATDAERAEIKRVLETGIYVNNPPE